MDYRKYDLNEAIVFDNDNLIIGCRILYAPMV